MQKLMPLWLCCFTAIVLFSCDKNAIVGEEPPAGPGWQLASGFIADSMVIRNSTVSNGQLYVMRDKYLSVVQKNGSAVHIPHGLDIPYALPLTSAYFVVLERNPDALLFVPTANPNNPKAKRIRIKPTDLGSDIVELPQWVNSGNLALNEKGQMMTTYLDKTKRPVFFLFDVVVESDSIQHIKNVSYKRITMPNIVSAGTIRTVGENYLVPITAPFTTEDRTALIRPNGSVATASKDHLYQIIDLDSIQFATGSNGFYESRNKGFSWAFVTNDIAARGQAFIYLSIMQGYTKINNRFVMYTPNLINTIESPKGAFYGRKDLNLDGMDNSWIIGIHEWGGRVFAVTEKGVYMRTIGNFFR